MGQIRLAQGTGDLTAPLQTVINLPALNSSKTLCAISHKEREKNTFFSLTALDVASCEFEIAFCNEGGGVGVGGVIRQF